jgi:predicted amidohydrolase
MGAGPVKNPSGSAVTALALALAALAAPAEPPANRNPDRLTMALVSMKSLYTDGPDATANRSNLEANLNRHLDFVDRAAAAGAEFVGFPEMSISGYHFSANTTWLRLDGPEVKALARKAAGKKVTIGAGIAEQDAAGKRWNTQFVVGPDGALAGWHHKIWLTKEKGVVEPGADHSIFEVKGVKMGIVTCADGSDFANLQALVDAGARILYGPHCNTTGGTTAGWYRFRAKWGGPWDGGMAPAKTNNDGPEAPMPSGGWIARLKVHASLVNQAGLYGSDLDPPPADANSGWAGGAWFVGPDGRTLAQAPASAQKSDSRECVLTCEIPVAGSR